MQTLKLSYVESLEKKIELYEMVIKRLNDKVERAEALLKEKDVEIDNLDFYESRARTGYDEIDERLRSLEKRYDEEKDAHSETYKELVMLCKKYEVPLSNVLGPLS